MKTITNKLKVVLVAIGFLTIGAVSAQSNTDGSGNVAKADATGNTIRLIDNKGTIKYMQANNGITAITSTEAGSLTTTTWQLGGTLVDDTYIDASGAIFALDGLELVTNISTASTDAADGSVHGGTTSGWTVLIRDEATGETKKIKASDLLQVQSGQQIFDASGTAATIGANNVTDMPADNSKVSAYRNGAKLLAGVDYTLAAGVLTLVDRSALTTSQGWTLYPADDVIEVHWVK